MKRFVVCFFIFSIVNFLAANGMVRGQSSAQWPTNISVGLLSNQLNQLFYLTVANEAVTSLKFNNIIPPDFNLTFYVNEGCDDNTAMKGAVKFWKDSNINVLFGPECSTGLNVVSLFASNINVPVFSYTPMPSDLENKTKFSTLIHMAFDYSETYQAIFALLKYYNWTRIGIVKTSAYCTSAMTALTTFLAQRQIQYVDLTIDLTKIDSVTLLLNLLQNLTRVNVVCSGSSPKDALTFLNFTDKFGMLNSEYVYILPAFQKDGFETWDNLILDQSPNENSRQLIKQLHKYSLIIQIDDGNFSQINNLNNTLTSVAHEIGQKSNSTVKPLIPAELQKLAVFRDSVYLYGLALNKTFSNGLYLGDNKSFIDACSNSQFTGISGEVIINDRIERLPEFIVFQLNDTWSPILRLGSNGKFNSSYEIQIIANLREPQWHTINNSVPKAFPLCGFGTAKCSDNSLIYPGNSVTIVVVVILALILFFVTLISGAYFYRKRLFEHRLYQMSWKVDLKNLRLVSKGEYLKSTVKFEKNLSLAQFSLINSFASSIKEGKFEVCGFYNNTMVAVKRWKKIAGLNLNRGHLVHLKALKDLGHENLNPFIGLVVDDGPAIIAIWNQCEKGSLNDIIYNDDIQLDIMFKVSILRDIIAGLDYLHSSSVGYHGKLHLSNCLVDSKWVIKLTDFGLEPIVEFMKQNNIIKSTEISNSDEKLLLIAPEILRNVNASNKKAADIYSFGMVAYQVLYRTGPFDTLKMDIEDAVTQIKRGGWAPPRPSLKPLHGCSSNLLYLINLCWHEIPLRRPTATSAKQEIFRSTKLFSKNLMDHVMAMLSKYATNLERIVAERTEKLNDERKRCDALFYQMLPKTIADLLTAGQSVDPETFDCATICFYDVVGFNSLCLLSTPYQLISTLTRLYSQIDYLISSFTCYKVETIGDTHCVVSELPEKNGTSQVCNIADLSLRILQLVDSFVIDHQPTYKLLSRIGVHSGPVACGVIGLSIPRFCLFGQSVTIASRMEKTGEVGKIQISENTKILLDSYSKYEVVRRRIIDVQPSTYWLLSRN